LDDVLVVFASLRDDDDEVELEAVELVDRKYFILIDILIDFLAWGVCFEVAMRRR
jgi:hypothetical protein